MSKAPRLGVCYYPEHWPQSLSEEDAQRMRDLGLRQVRIGEFAWGRLEPSPGDFRWDWLDRAVDTLGGAGLDIMLGTPTATPPKWLVDAHPDILAYDRHGRPRRFGSRRHYCFSSQTYRREAARIVEAVADRYGRHDAVRAWQTDNEYGCHDTVRSYSPEAERAFRKWLASRYREIGALNEAWGAVFWSQEYRNFEEVDLPNLTVTEPNPSHVLDFFRFSSDQVISFNRMQTEIIRQHAPGRDIVHNFMGFFFDFDHFALGADLDGAAWDSYPIGFLDVGPFPLADKERYMRQGHPDIAAFHHDLYRACGRGRWQVIEQQPGPVNWAPHNPAPLDGMVRLWTLEAIAHGAEAVSYFRWRQAPFAQEQMHAGLLRPDSEPAAGYAEAQRAARDVQTLAPAFPKTAAPVVRADVALVFSYEACWLFEAQPQGAGWNYPAIVFAWYSTLRRLGFDVDIVSPDATLDSYNLVAAPSLPIVDDALAAKLAALNAQVLLGPRTGSKTRTLTIPDALPPGALQKALGLKVTHSESFPGFHRLQGEYNGETVHARAWLDHVESSNAPLAAGEEGGFLFAAGALHYLATLPEPDFLARIFAALAAKAGIAPAPTPADIRIRRRGGVTFAFNYGPGAIELGRDTLPDDAALIVGERTLPPAGVAAWRSADQS